MKTYEIAELGTVYRLEPGDDARGVEELLASDVPVAFDTETSGLDPYAADFRHRLSQFGSADTAYVWVPEEFPALDRLVTTTRPVWYFNADYDTRVLDKARGITLEETWPFVIDASILSRLIDPRKAKDGGVDHSMDAQAQERLGLGAKGEAKQALLKAGRQYGLKSSDAMWAGIPTDDETYVRYAGQDALLTSRLGAHLLGGIDYFDLQDIATFEHAVGYAVSTIIRRGWKIDRPYAEAAIEKFEHTFREEDAKLASMGVRPTKSSGLHVTSRLGLIDRFTELGVTFTEFTDTGAPKLDDEVLQAIAIKRDDEAAELAQAVLKAKKPQKAAGTIRGYLTFADPDDRVHAGINPLGTKTGRMSSSKPNLQNPDRDIPEVRGCYVPEPGHVHITVDYSGVEWRVAAGVTDDSGLRGAFRRGEDPHKVVAELIHGDRFRNADKVEQKRLRGEAKTRGLGKLYGQGYRGAAKQEGIPEADMKAVHDAIDALYPGIRTKIDEMKDVIDGPTPLTLETGRRVIADAGYRALNYLCQGPARDLLAYAVLRLFEAGLGENICMLVHDEIVLSVPELEAEAYLEKVQDLMRSEFLGVRIESEGEVLGERWRK